MQQSVRLQQLNETTGSSFETKYWELNTSAASSQFKGVCPTQRSCLSPAFSTPVVTCPRQYLTLCCAPDGFSPRPLTAASPWPLQDGQAIKDGVRQRVNKWRHELAPSFRSSSLVSSSSSSCSSSPSAGSASSTSAGKAASSGGGGSGGTSSSGGGRTSGGADVLPFLIPLARLARQLEIDAALYAAR